MPAGVDWEDGGEEGWEDEEYDEYEDDSPDDADARQVLRRTRARIIVAWNCNSIVVVVCVFITGISSSIVGME